MQCGEFLSSIEDRLSDHLERAAAVRAKLTPDQLNWSPEPAKWSIAQIFEHLILTNTPYVPAIKNGVEAAEKRSGEIKHTFFGKFLIKNAGPKGNAPAPKQLHPRPGPYGMDVIDKWAAQTQSLLDLAKGSKGVDLCSFRIHDPLLKMFKMNLADCFLILTEHTERHIQQIEFLHNRCAADMPSTANR